MPPPCRWRPCPQPLRRRPRPPPSRPRATRPRRPAVPAAPPEALADGRPVPVVPYPRLVVARGQSLLGLDEDGRLDRQLTDPALRAGSPAAAAGGLRLAVVRRGDLWTLFADGSSQQLTRTPEVEGSPAWSPGGQRLAFDRVDAASGRPTCGRCATTDGGAEPHARAAGRRHPGLVARRRGAVFERDLEAWTMRADGTKAQDLTAAVPGSQHDPSWSPDGATIAFVCVTDAGLDGICTIPATGGRARALVPHGVPGANGPAWSGTAAPWCSRPTTGSGASASTAGTCSGCSRLAASPPSPGCAASATAEPRLRRRPRRRARPRGRGGRAGRRTGAWWPAP